MIFLKNILFLFRVFAQAIDEGIKVSVCLVIIVPLITQPICIFRIFASSKKGVDLL